MSLVAIPSIDSESIPVYSESQQRLGLTGLSLLLAIKDLHVNLNKAVMTIQREIEVLAGFPEPETRHMVRLVLSFLDDADITALESVRDRVESLILIGELDELDLLAA